MPTPERPSATHCGRGKDLATATGPLTPAEVAKYQEQISELESKGNAGLAERLRDVLEIAQNGNQDALAQLRALGGDCTEAHLVDAPARGSSRLAHESPDSPKTPGPTEKMACLEIHGVTIILPELELARLQERLKRELSHDDFVRLCEQQISKECTKEGRERLAQELARYKTMPPAEQAEIRKASMEQARAKARGHAIGRAAEGVGTLVLIGMAADFILEHTLSEPETESYRPTVTPQVKH